MRVFKSERMTIDKVGSTGGECYLVSTSERTLLYDAGFAYSASALIAELEELLGVRSLDYIFLSHSHYDHVSGSVWLKERWPDAVVLAGAHAAQVFERPGARKTMRRLNAEAAHQFYEHDDALRTAYAAFDYAPLDKLSVDSVVTEGATIDMGGVHLEVIAAPGHTRCSLMLWCPEEELLFGSESLGVYVSNELVSPAYLVSYADALETIEKAKALHPKHILANHRNILTGSDSELFLKNAEYWAQETARLVWDGHSNGMTRDELLALVKEIHYPEEVHQFQPEAAFDVNNDAVINQLLACKPEAR